MKLNSYLLLLQLELAIMEDDTKTIEAIKTLIDDYIKSNELDLILEALKKIDQYNLLIKQ